MCQVGITKYAFVLSSCGPSPRVLIYPLGASGLLYTHREHQNQLEIRATHLEPLPLHHHHAASSSPRRTSSHDPFKPTCSKHPCLRGFVFSAVRCYKVFKAIGLENMGYGSRHTGISGPSNPGPLNRRSLFECVEMGKGLVESHRHE